MGLYGHTSKAWEGVFHALLIILTPEKFYNHLRRQGYVFVCPTSTNCFPVVTFSPLGSICIHNLCLSGSGGSTAGHGVPSMVSLPISKDVLCPPAGQHGICLRYGSCDSSSSWQKGFIKR